MVTTYSTQWSLILAARDHGPVKARAALDALLRAYWPPLYSFIRHRGHAPETAEDLTQTFCARLLESNDLATVDRSKGKFRAFLLAACTHFLRTENIRDGQVERFEVFKSTLTGDRVPLSELAARLNTTVGAIQVATHRLRQRYRDALRARVAATVDAPSQIDDEIRDLFAALDQGS